MRDNNRTVKIELLSQWKLEAEFRNFKKRKNHISQHCLVVPDWGLARAFDAWSQMGFAISANEVDETGGVLTNESSRLAGPLNGSREKRRQGNGREERV